MTDEQIYSKPETDLCTMSVAGLLYKEEHTQGENRLVFYLTSVVERVINNHQQSNVS